MPRCMMLVRMPPRVDRGHGDVRRVEFLLHGFGEAWDTELGGGVGGVPGHGCEPEGA